MMEEQNRPYKRIMNLTTCGSAVVRLRQPGVNWHSSRRLAYYGLEAWKSILVKKKKKKKKKHPFAFSCFYFRLNS